MTIPGQNPLSYLNEDGDLKPIVLVRTRAPTANDIPNNPRTFWHDSTNGNLYFFNAAPAGAAEWIVVGTDFDIPLDVSDGGTGLTTVTANAIVIGDGANPLDTVGPLTDGQLLIGETGADPSAATLTSADSSIQWTGGSGTLDGVVNPNIAQQATVTLSATEIKALATTQIELVAAPAAGSALVFEGAVLKLVAGSEVLTESGDNLGIKYTDDSGVQVSQTIESTGFIDQAADTYTNARPDINAIVAASAGEAAPLVIDNLGNNFAGNASDDAQLVISTTYRVVTI
ncbi:MAG: hypothetical protein PVI43_01275 [Candidatus Bathyarchaeota archaeon]|jgi:hypothetical protein